MYVRAVEMDEKTLGPHHPDLATSLNGRAQLLKLQVRNYRAPVVYTVPSNRVWIIRSSASPTDMSHISRRSSLEPQGNYADARQLLERALTIREKFLGPEHPAVAESLNDRAVLCGKQVGNVWNFQGVQSGFR